jgi:preprotein translocase subunit SecD
MHCLFVIAAVLAGGCGNRRDANDKPADEPTTEEPVEIQLVDQPTIKNGVRSAFLIEGADAAALERAVRTIRIRLQLAKIPSHVSVKGQELVVDMGTSDPETTSRAHDLIWRGGRFEVRFAEAGAAYMKALAEHAATDSVAKEAGITSSPDGWKVKGAQITDWYLRARDRAKSVTGEEARALGCATGLPPDARIRCNVTGGAAIEGYVAQLAARDARFAVPADRVLVYQHVTRSDDIPHWRTFFAERKLEVTNDELRRATVVHDRDSEAPLLEIQLHRATAGSLSAASAKHVGQKLIIAVDRQVWAAPIYAGWKAADPLWITIRNQDPDRQDAEARALAIVLQSGALLGPGRLQYQAELVDGIPRSEPP